MFDEFCGTNFWWSKSSSADCSHEAVADAAAAGSAAADAEAQAGRAVQKQQEWDALRDAKRGI